MHNYVPSPAHTVPGQPPQVGQASIYVDDDGNTYPGMITAVMGTLANGNWKVAFLLVKPSASQLVADPSKLGNPAAFELNGWQYNPTLGRVAYCPCVPPDPSITCP